MNTDDIIQKTVDYTIMKLKLSGLMKDNRKTAYQKTEQILKDYNELNESYSENGTAKKFVDIVNKAFGVISDDPYFDVITMYYIENKTREEIAEFYETTPTTISRNKRRLVDKLKTLIFADDVIYELFL